MLGKEHVRFIREHMAPHRAPVLSLYTDVNPAKPENARKGWFIRVKDSLKALAIPGELYDRVITLVGEDRPRARTLVLFAAEDLLERYDLQVDMPVVDLAQGRVEVRWGEPYVAPLLYALDEYARAGVLDIEQTDWRFYEVYLGEIEDATDMFRTVAPEEWNELEKYLPSFYNELLKERVATHPDRFPQRMEMWAHRFLKRLAHLLERVVVERDIGRLVLMGPEEETRFFEQYLSRNLRQRVVAHVSDIPTPNPSAAQVLEKVAPALEAAERAQEQVLLDTVQNKPGVWGLEPTLEALQMGRVSVLVAAWSLEARIWRCPDGWVGGTPEQARTFCLDQEPREVALRSVIVDLAENFGTRLEFVRGEAEQRLLDQFGGLAGLLRW